MEVSVEKELKQLDEVLKLFRTNWEMGGLQFDFIVRHFDPEYKNGFSHSLVSIIEKMLRDNLIFEQNSSYHISSEGKIFEGYLQKRINTEREEARIVNIEREQKRHQEQIFYLTLILAVGGLISAFYYGIEIYKFYF